MEAVVNRVLSARQPRCGDHPSELGRGVEIALVSGATDDGQGACKIGGDPRARKTIDEGSRVAGDGAGTHVKATEALSPISEDHTGNNLRECS